MSQPAAQTVVAAFDFDGTLTRRDTVVPFLRRLAGDRALATAALREARRLVPAAARRDRDRLRSIASDAVFAGRPDAEVLAAARVHGEEILSGGLRSDTLGRLAWHDEAGHIIVIVSASYEAYVRVVADRLPVGARSVDVLATRLEVVDGVCTGRLRGANCRGPEKVRRLEHWLADRSLERSAVSVHAYGDSAGDREMLAWADHPTMVNGPLTSVAPTA